MDVQAYAAKKVQEIADVSRLCDVEGE